MIGRLSGDAEIVSLSPGEFLFREGDEADALYIVKRGVLRVISGETVFEIVKPGGIVGEMGIVDVESLGSASVIAGTYAEVTGIDIAGFLTLVESTPDFALIVMRDYGAPSSDYEPPLPPSLGVEQATAIANAAGVDR